MEEQVSPQAGREKNRVFRDFVHEYRIQKARKLNFDYQPVQKTWLNSPVARWVTVERNRTKARPECCSQTTVTGWTKLRDELYIIKGPTRFASLTFINSKCTCESHYSFINHRWSRSKLSTRNKWLWSTILRIHSFICMKRSFFYWRTIIRYSLRFFWNKNKLENSYFLETKKQFVLFNKKKVLKFV